MPFKVLHITGAGRSGTTILARVLGHLEGFVSIGELTNHWTHILEHRLCTCARPFGDCPFWSRVLEPDLLDPGKVRAVEAARQDLLKQPILRRLDLWRENHDALDEASDRYAPVLADVYRRVRRISGCDVIVDNSKQPAHAYAVGRVPDCETFVLHVVRDSRAVAFSRRRHEHPDRAETAVIARYWMLINLKTEYLLGIRSRRARYLRIRYEDFAGEPKAHLEEILRFIGEERDIDALVDGLTLRLTQPIHDGSPSRFPPGPVSIYQDHKWATDMPRKDRLSTLALTWPLLLRYGYPKAHPRPRDRA